MPATPKPDPHIQRQHTRLALRDSGQLFHCVFDAVEDGIIVADCETLEFQLANPALTRMLGYSHDELMTLSLTDLHPADTAAAAHETYASMAAGELRKARLPLRRKDGSVFNAELGTGMMELEGRRFMVCLVHDLSTFERAEQAEELARRDGLTGLHNHRAFQELLVHELARAQRHGTPLTLLMLDIDHFKKVNDTLGHQAGDAVLRQLGALLLDGARNIDHVCRYGGEEFMLILPMTTTAEAWQVAERLRLLVAGFEFACGVGYRQLSVSIGIASYPLHAQTQTALIAAADQAMYSAKRSGRNRCCIFEADPARRA